MEDIKLTIKSFIDSLGILESTIEVDIKGGVHIIKISSPEEYSLIGKENERYDAFSHLTKRILAKKFGESVRVIIDINGVQQYKDEQLKNRAVLMSDRAKFFKMDVELEPMSSYDRMVIHSHLENISNIKTESVGEGRDRHLVIRFIPEKTKTEIL
jgi:spoIIIJ-associated protein